MSNSENHAHKTLCVGGKNLSAYEIKNLDHVLRKDTYHLPTMNHENMVNVLSKVVYHLPTMNYEP